MTQTSLLLRAACAMTCAGAGLAAHADTGPDLRVSGFGSLIATHVNADGVEYVNPAQTSGAGRDWSFKTDSRLGLQLDATLNERFAATVQLLSKHNGSGNETPKVEWAFARAKLDGGFVLRAGRMGAPFFAVSDFREVGYANTWLRTPTPVYGQIFLRSFDGVDLGYSGSVFGKPVTVQLLAGGTTVPYERTNVDYKKQLGLNATLELTDGLTLRAGQTNGRLSVNSASMTQLVNVLGTTPFAGVGQQIDCTNRRASFGGIGLSLDQGNWVGAAEFTRRRADCYVPDTSGWHVMAGYRFGPLTPYVAVAKVKRDDANVVNTIPGGVNPTLDMLSATVNGLIDSVAVENESVALGLRWDAYRNTAVKLQWERVDAYGRRGMFRPVGTLPQGPVQVLSVGVDFVF